MKHLKTTVLILFLLAAGTTQAQQFETNFQVAQEKCEAEGKSLVMVFCGSDWCKPCILLHNEVLESAAFEAFSADHLVVLKLDFPYRKKNQLPPAQRQHNEELADTYNPKGAFPLVLLVNPDGSVAKQVQYQPGNGPEPIIAQISSQLPN